jgi:hypothetical protein
MSEREQEKKLIEIIDRLSQQSWANRDLLRKSSQIARQKWPLAKVIAYFDLLDIEERT